MFAVRLERLGTSGRKKLSVHVPRPEVSGAHGSPRKPPRATGGSVHIGEAAAVADRRATHRHVGVFGTVP